MVSLVTWGSDLVLHLDLIKVNLHSLTHISEFVPYSLSLSYNKHKIDPIVVCHAVWHLANMFDCENTPSVRMNACAIIPAVDKMINKTSFFRPEVEMYIRASIPSYRQVGGAEEAPLSPTTSSPSAATSPWKSYFVYQVPVGSKLRFFLKSRVRISPVLSFRTWYITLLFFVCHLIWIFYVFEWNKREKIRFLKAVIYFFVRN
jgi:hypothetical protein